MHLELDHNFEIVLNEIIDLFIEKTKQILPSVNDVVCRQCSSGKRHKTSSRSICRMDGNFGLYNCFLTDANLYLGA
jgi:hypothetical protein